jgi:hypothetical protein
MQLHLQWNSGDKCFHAINAKIINFDKYSSLKRAFFDVFFSCEVHCNTRHTVLLALNPTTEASEAERWTCTQNGRKHSSKESIVYEFGINKTKMQSMK